MAITATFTADFDDFNREVDKAEGELMGFEQQTLKTGTSIGTLSGTARQFDSTLQALGINIGPATRAIAEIEAVAGKSATALGVLGTAGAVLSAGIAGWQIGRKIAESIGTDKWIADSVAKWMGWGDVAKETAGAVADAAKYAAERTVPEVEKITKAFAVDAKQKAEWIAAQKAEWDAAFAIRDRLFGDDAIKKAEDYAKAIGLLAGSMDSLTQDQLVELEAAMLAGIDAMARSGRLTDEQSSAFARLAQQAAAAKIALEPVVAVTEDLAKAQWDYAVATDQALAASIKQRDEAAKTTEAAKTQQAEGAGVGIGLISQTRGAGTDLFGRPTIAPGGLNPININILQPLGTPEGIAAAVGSAISDTYRRGGNRVPV